MTDITELVQSLKAAAEKATPGQWMRSSVQFNSITDIANPMEQGNKPHIANTSEKRDAEFIAMANPTNILTLVEVLEKAQQENTDGVAGMAESYETTISMLRSRIAELEEAERKLCAANVTLDARAEQAERERENWRTSFDNERFRADKLKAHIDDIEPIRAAAEKLVRCKGRYHSELNYRALAALFGVTSPDLPPLDSESCTVTVKPDDADEVREEGNQFLVVRHPGKVPVIKHPVGQLEDYLLQILKADPLATIDIVTHRYYGVGGQFVEDADEYLHEMGIKLEAE